jgi:hypothetical protein
MSVSRNRQDIYQTQRQTVLRTHQQGMALEIIASITELSPDEVREILSKESAV